MRFVVSVVFTPTRGVIHPSFPLRGRWERIAKKVASKPHFPLGSPLFSTRHVKRTHATSLMHGAAPLSVEPCEFLIKSFINKYLGERKPQSR